MDIPKSFQLHRAIFLTKEQNNLFRKLAKIKRIDKDSSNETDSKKKEDKDGLSRDWILLCYIVYWIKKGNNMNRNFIPFPKEITEGIRRFTEFTLAVSKKARERKESQAKNDTTENIKSIEGNGSP